MSENLPEIIEQKFNFALTSREQIVDWLEYVYLKDPVYHYGVVNSLYYDTPLFDHHFEKLNSDYLKFKVRLRWYGDVVGNGATPCFLEVKRKIGSIRRKKRTLVHVPSSLLQEDFFDQEFIQKLSDNAIANDYQQFKNLIPLIHIRYERMRYIDPHCNARIAIDWNIGCKAYNQTYVTGKNPEFKLSVGVLEVKEKINYLPLLLEPISSLLFKNSFSKYSECLSKINEKGP